MAININVQDLVNAVDKMSNAEQLAFSQLIWQGNVLNDDFKSMHKIIQGVKNGDRIPLAQTPRGFDYMKSTKGNASQCDDNSCDVNVTLSSKKWDTGRYNCATEFCYKDLPQLLKDFFNSDVCSFEEFGNSAFLQFISEVIGGKLKDSLWVKTYFAELGSADTTLNGNDGVFIQMEALAPVNDTKRVVIPENANADYATQSALAPQRGFDVYSAILKARSRNLKKAKDTPIYTTRALAENYQEWLRASKQVTCCAKDPLTNDYAIENLYIYGTPIKVVDVVDDIINELPAFNNGTSWVNPHRAWMIQKDNMPIGTCNEDAFSDFSLKVNDYAEKMKIKPEYELGVKILNDEDFVLAI